MDEHRSGSSTHLLHQLAERRARERARAALEHPRKAAIARFAVARRGRQWTVGELGEHIEPAVPLRNLYTLCMQLVVCDLLEYVPSVDPSIRDQPFRASPRAVAMLARDGNRRDDPPQR
jgi:hypothetical protein